MLEYPVKLFYNPFAMADEETGTQIGDGRIDSHIELVCTTLCPFKCPYCYGRENFTHKGKHVPFEILKKRIDHVLETGLFSNSRLILIGGESLLHDNFFEIIDYWNSRSLGFQYTNYIGVVTAGSFSASMTSKLKETFKKPTRWELSLHNERNFKAFSRFLNLYFSDFQSKNQDPLRIHIVFSSEEQGLKSLDYLYDAVNGSSFGRKMNRMVFKKMEKKIKEIKDPANPKTGDAYFLKGSRQAEIIVFIAASYGFDSPDYDGGRAFICPMLETERPVGIVIDERGYVKPCSTPNQRLASQLFEKPLDKFYGSKELWLETWQDRQSFLLKFILGNIHTEEEPLKSISSILRREDICRFCCSDSLRS